MSVNETRTSTALPSSTVVSVNGNSPHILSAPAVAAIVIAISVSTVLLGGTVLFFMRRMRKHRKRTGQMWELEGNYDKIARTVKNDYYYGHIDGDLNATQSLFRPFQPLPVPIVELSGSEIQRAELHSPEPDSSRSPTLVDRQSIATAEPEQTYTHPHEAWTTRLEIPRPGSSSRDSNTPANVAFGAQPTLEIEPAFTAIPSSQCNEPSTPTFQSPVDYTQFNSSPLGFIGSNAFSNYEHEFDPFLTQPPRSASIAELQTAAYISFDERDTFPKSRLLSGSCANPATISSPNHACNSEVVSPPRTNQRWLSNLDASYDSIGTRDFSIGSPASGPLYCLPTSEPRGVIDVGVLSPANVLTTQSGSRSSGRLIRPAPKVVPRCPQLKLISRKPLRDYTVCTSSSTFYEPEFGSQAMHQQQQVKTIATKNMSINTNSISNFALSQAPAAQVTIIENIPVDRSPSSAGISTMSTTWSCKSPHTDVSVYTPATNLSPAFGWYGLPLERNMHGHAFKSVYIMIH
ncbi:hypothetical protein MMC13_007557 [Lambiella insularis]|nr:hypothetical protein [Lambiella insularis]